MERLGHGPVFRASLGEQIKDDIKFLTTSSGVHGLLAMENGKKTSDVSNLVGPTNGPANIATDPTASGGSAPSLSSGYTPYLIGAALLVAVFYYTRS